MVGSTDTNEANRRFVDVIGDHVLNALNSDGMPQQHHQANFNYNLLSSLLSNAVAASATSSPNSTEVVQHQQHLLTNFELIQNEYLKR
jgi:hypothetical protein